MGQKLGQENLLPDLLFDPCLEIPRYSPPKHTSELLWGYFFFPRFWALWLTWAVTRCRVLILVVLGISMTSSERPSQEPLLKKEASPYWGGDNSGNALAASSALNCGAWGIPVHRGFQKFDVNFSYVPFCSLSSSNECLGCSDNFSCRIGFEIFLRLCNFLHIGLNYVVASILIHWLYTLIIMIML